MQDEFMTPEQWARLDRVERTRRSVATSTAIETGEPSQSIYERLTKRENRINVDLCDTVRCRTCHGTGFCSSGDANVYGCWTCRDCNGTGVIKGVFEPYD